MPIRFRCINCNQLLGIAHRKAGTTVRCPTCAGQVVVPDPDTPNHAEPTAPEPAAAPLFERSDFDDLFGAMGPRTEPRDPRDRVVPVASLPDLPLTADASPREATAAPARPDYDVERITLVPAAVPGPVVAVTPGIVLSPAKATLLTVAAIVALGLAFTAGLLLGLVLRSGH